MILSLGKNFQLLCFLQGNIVDTKVFRMVQMRNINKGSLVARDLQPYKVAARRI